MRILLAALLVGSTILGAALSGLVGTAEARDTEYKLKIDEVIQSADGQAKLKPDVKFFFGSQKAPAGKTLESAYVANPKTNSFGKSDETACRWAMLSALIDLQDQARRQGGNAVVNIVSYYKKNEFSSPTDYDCHAGAIIAGVALKGDIVKLP
jgi:uncharacterized protein YbjQ (UPF0145 family)